MLEHKTVIANGAANLVLDELNFKFLRAFIRKLRPHSPQAEKTKNVFLPLRGKTELNASQLDEIVRTEFRAAGYTGPVNFSLIRKATVTHVSNCNDKKKEREKKYIYINNEPYCNTLLWM